MRITDSVIIDRPIDEVFAYAGDPTNDAEWSTAFLDARITSDGPVAKGSTVIEQMRFLGKRIDIDCEITEYEPGRRVTYDMAVGKNKGVHVRTFESVEGGTQLTLLTEGDAGGLFKVAEPVLNKVGTRQLSADLHALKAMLESTG
jgi:uncharacterized membrane protein